LIYCARVAVGVIEDLSPLRFLQLVAHPLRWRILRELAVSDRRVRELTALLAEPQNLVSYHLRQLHAAGLVAARRSAADGRDNYYCVDLARCGELLGATGAALHPALVLAPVVPPQVPTGANARPARILFLCTGNSARSQMAEALAEHLGAGAVTAWSAGSHPKALHPNAVRVMADRGIDLSGHRSEHLRVYARRRFDAVVTLCDRVREVCPEFPGPAPRMHWSMADPSAAAGQGASDEASYPAFVRTAAELELRIGFLLAAINSAPRPRAARRSTRRT
jgi:ArsR family transcriptional regulator, arsenate/arsenite/antimonite-responsive transcriptional repressor / arsenate reductase (thioredoxin)